MRRIYADELRRLDAYARTTAAKGEGRQIAGAVTRDGARVEVACEAQTLLALDSDAGLDPRPLLDVLDRATASWIWQASASSTPTWPKWHLILPLYRPLSPPSKPAWQARVAWTIGYLEGVAGYPGPRALEAPPGAPEGFAAFCERHGRGLDPCTDGLVQMSFCAARRTAEQAPPPLDHRGGIALDLDALLRLTGYDPDHSRATWEAERGKPRAAQGVPLKVAEADAIEVAADPEPGRPVLVRALAAAGWLGPWRRGAWAAWCPWWGQHGDAADDPRRSAWSARVWARAGAATWWCSHAACAQRLQSHVRAAIPAEAWAAARGRPGLAVRRSAPALAAERPGRAADRGEGARPGRAADRGEGAR